MTTRFAVNRWASCRFSLFALLITMIASASVLWVPRTPSAQVSTKKATTHKPPLPVLTLRDFSEANGIDAIVFSPNGNMLAALTDKGVMVCSTRTGNLFYQLEGGYRVAGAPHIAFSPDGCTLAVAFTSWIKADNPVEIHLYEAGSGKPLGLMNNHGGDLTGLIFCPDGKWLMTASNDDTVRLWDLKNRRKVITLKALAPLWSNIACCRDGRLLACGGNKGLTLWDLSSGKARLLPGVPSRIYSVAFQPDGKRLALGFYDPGVAGLIDATTDQIIRPYAPEHSEIEIWDVQPPRKVLTLFRGEEGQEGVENLQFSPDGHILASSAVGSVRLWDGKTGKPLGIIPTVDDFSAARSCFAFSPDGRFLATGFQEKKTHRDGRTTYRDVIKVWRTETLRQFSLPPKPPSPEP